MGDSDSLVLMSLNQDGRVVVEMILGGGGRNLRRRQVSLTERFSCGLGQ